VWRWSRWWCLPGLMTSGTVTSAVDLSTSRVWYEVDRQQLSTYWLCHPHDSNIGHYRQYPVLQAQLYQWYSRVVEIMHLQHLQSLSACQWRNDNLYCGLMVRRAAFRSFARHIVAVWLIGFSQLLHFHVLCDIFLTTTVLRPFFWDNPGELVPEENFWALWCKGRLTKADTLTIWMATTPCGLSSAHLHYPPFFTGRMPFLPPNQQCQSTEGN